MNKLKSLLLFMLLFLSACIEELVIEKTPPPLLSEIIYGDWEIKATIAVPPSREDTFYTALEPPYGYYRFYESNKYETWYLDQAISLPESFIVRDQDSTILRGANPAKVNKFDENRIEYTFFDGHGTFRGEVLYKKED